MADDSTKRVSGRVARRELLRLIGGASGAVLLPLAGRLLQPAPAAATTPAGRSAGVREIRLTAAPVRSALLPGRVVTAWAYNGTVPGPTIRVPEGERVRIVVANRLPEATTVHWHGIDVPMAMDGVPGLTQEPIRPGQSFTYEFDARPAGTRWYHTHAHDSGQLDKGLYGLFVIDPRREPERPQREYVLVLGSWLTGEAATVPVAPSRGAGGGKMDGGMMGGGMMQGMRGMMPVPEQDYDTFTVNGKAFPSTTPLRVTKGQRVRLRLVNASGNRDLDVRLDGHALKITHTDGNPLAQPVEVDALSVGPSERYDVEFTADRPGKWAFRALDPATAAAGLNTFVVYDGYDRAPASADDASEGDLRWWSYANGQGRDVLPGGSGQRRRYQLTLGWSMMRDPNRWTINGRVYPDTPPLRAQSGDVVSVHIFNMTPESHPMHLHGQSFRVMAVNGRRLPSPLVKDSVSIASMGAVDLEIVAHHPGKWLFHCHKLMHMDGGMMTLLEYV